MQQDNLDLGIIGNCQYSALVSPSGNIAWMCWPRFDASFVFGGLLDAEAGGAFQIAPADGSRGVQRYVENTNILVTRFTPKDGCFEVIDFAPRFREADHFQKPTALVRIIRLIEGTPAVIIRCRPRYEYGKAELTPNVRSNHILYADDEHKVRLYTDASLSMILEERPFVLTKSKHLLLSWEQKVEEGIGDLCEAYLIRTKTYWEKWVKHCHLPRNHLREVIRSALVLKLHQFEDTGAIIAATTMSIPEADQSGRNWDYRYCWLRDAQFALDAFRQLGHFEELEVFVDYLRTVGLGAKEGLQPVYGISGETNLDESILDHLSGYHGNKPVRLGNQAYTHVQNDIYGEMIVAISPLFLDPRFPFEASAKPKALLSRLLSDIEVRLEQKDAGLWEFRNIARVHTFSVLMHWVGANEAVKIAKACGYDDIGKRAESILARAERILNEQCWQQDIGAFTQAVGSHELDAALLQMVNLGFLTKKDPRSLSHVKATVQQLTLSGRRLLRRYKNQDDFGDTENAFVVCTFWLAEAYGRLGLEAEARLVFQEVASSANALGLFSEDLDPRTKQRWGNFPQVYSHVGLINAAFALGEG